MAAFDRTPGIEISNKPGWEPHEMIKIKGTLSAADIDAMVFGEAHGQITQSMLWRMITSWTLVDPNTQKHAEVDEAFIAILPSIYVVPVIAEIQRLRDAVALPDIQKKA